MPEIITIGELLHWSYANLAMAHAGITAKADKYGRTQFMVRARLYSGLNKNTMNIGPLADDERLKMVLPQACCYCGSRMNLSIDHLIPTKRGGANTGGDNKRRWSSKVCSAAWHALSKMKSLSDLRPTSAARRNTISCAGEARSVIRTERFDEMACIKVQKDCESLCCYRC